MVNNLWDSWAVIAGLIFTFWCIFFQSRRHSTRFANCHSLIEFKSDLISFRKWLPSWHWFFEGFFLPAFLPRAQSPSAPDIFGCQSNKVQVKALSISLGSPLSLNNSMPECRQRFPAILPECEADFIIFRFRSRFFFGPFCAFCCCRWKCHMQIQISGVPRRKTMKIVLAARLNWQNDRWQYRVERGGQEKLAWALKKLQKQSKWQLK